MCRKNYCFNFILFFLLKHNPTEVYVPKYLSFIQRLIKNPKNVKIIYRGKFSSDNSIMFLDLNGRCFNPLVCLLTRCLCEKFKKQEICFL